MTDAPWWRSAVVYQIYPRSFADSDGDGIGDLRGIIDRVDHLARLGVDVVWLSPIYPSPQDDAGYDISDYENVDPTFGTLADVDELIAALHDRGIKLVMDLVVNHTSDEHSWFVESRSDPRSEKRDWYFWRPPRAGMEPGQPGAEPTNWVSFFSGPAWELDPASGEYYLHLFARKQPDLNWENPQVRAAVYRMMRGWVERGVDGFRMDVINFISKVVGPDGALPDGIVTAATSPYGDGSAGFICGPRIHEFLAEMHREVFAGLDAVPITVGEMPGVTVEQAVLFTDPARAEVDMVFQFEHVALDQGAVEVGRAPVPAAGPQGVVRPLAGGPGRDRLEQPVLEQPRPAADRVALGRRRRVPGAVGDDARDGAAPAPRHALRLPGRGARHAQHAVRLDRRLPRHRVAQPLRRRRRARGGSGARARRAAGDGPRQRAHPGAVGRLAARRVHHRHARGSPSTPTTRRSTRRRRSTTPARSSRTTAG